MTPTSYKIGDGELPIEFRQDDEFLLVNNVRPERKPPLFHNFPEPKARPNLRLVFLGQRALQDPTNLRREARDKMAETKENKSKESGNVLARIAI
jgi:hypothetical protein